MPQMTVPQLQQPTSLRDKIIAFNRALTVSEVSALFGISEGMIYKQARSGVIPNFRIGTSVRFDPKPLIDWLERQ